MGRTRNHEIPTEFLIPTELVKRIPNECWPPKPKNSPRKEIVTLRRNRSDSAANRRPIDSIHSTQFGRARAFCKSETMVGTFFISIHHEVPLCFRGQANVGKSPPTIFSSIQNRIHRDPGEDFRGSPSPGRGRVRHRHVRDTPISQRRIPARWLNPPPDRVSRRDPCPMFLIH